MAHVFVPKLNIGGVIYPFPEPIYDFAIEDAADVSEHKVPHYQGLMTYAPSSKGTTITVVGRVAKVDNDGTAQFTVSEQQMFEQAAAMRQAIIEQEDGAYMELIFYYDVESSTYRKFKQVTWRQLLVKIGDDDRVPFGYQFTFVADDPVIYSEAPGGSG